MFATMRVQQCNIQCASTSTGITTVQYSISMIDADRIRDSSHDLQLVTEHAIHDCAMSSDCATYARVTRGHDWNTLLLNARKALISVIQILP